jgi:hypothetical protein
MDISFSSAVSYQRCCSRLADYEITRSALRLLERSANIFDLNVEKGGVRCHVRGHTFYTEVSGGQLPGILDGFLVSLIALHELYRETSDPKVRRLFEEGIDGLQSLLTILELS